MVLTKEERAKISKREYRISPAGRLMDKKIRAKRRARARLLILNSKKNKCCSFCGYKEHPEILQFHHNKGNKTFTLAEGVHQDKNIELLSEEITKCILICPNCHSWLHFKEHNGKSLQIRNSIKQRRT